MVFKIVVYGYTDVLYIVTAVFVKGHRTEEIWSYSTALKLLEGPVKEMLVKQKFRYRAINNNKVGSLH